jgi:hypothetical protein
MSKNYNNIRVIDKIDCDTKNVFFKSIKNF